MSPSDAVESSTDLLSTDPLAAGLLDADVIDTFVAAQWTTIVPVLTEYIAIPNKSPVFDPEWAANGHMATAVELFRAWAAARSIDGLVVDVVQLDDRTPVITCEIPATPGVDTTTTTLLYGHLDKQPEMEGWDEDKGPWTPVMVGERLYGRGGADDGYALFAALTAVEALRAAGGRHGRLVVLIEASEESGSPDLPAYVDHLAPLLGDVGLVICLDSGAADYDALWVTTSLRGLAGGTLDVQVANVGLHSGSVSGVVPSSFRILRSLLDRIEDSATGEMLLPELHVDIPDDRRRQTEASVAALDGQIVEPDWLHGTTEPMVDDPVEQALARTWRPALSVTGLAGAPHPDDAGNVLRPHTSAKLSVRLPPTADPDAALVAIERALTTEPPHRANVTFRGAESGPGWAAPPLEPWLDDVLRAASMAHFGRPAGYQGEGGSIPFMGMLGDKFPDAQFVITGVLGPESNAHGPNEFLDLPTARRVAACVAQILHADVSRAPEPDPATAT